MERQADGEDLEIPNIVTLDVNAIVEKHRAAAAFQQPQKGPHKSNKRHPRIDIESLAGMAPAAAAPPHKRSRKVEITTLEKEIVEIHRMLAAKEAKLAELKASQCKKHRTTTK